MSQISYDYLQDTYALTKVLTAQYTVRDIKDTRSRDV